MELRTFQIDLDSLEEVKPQQLPFDVELKKADLEYFARSIIKLGGLLRIPVVERTGIDSYRLIEGHFDYLAYLKARELNPDLPDRIRVFIMEKDNSEPVQTQLKVLRDLEISIAINSSTKYEGNSSSSTTDLKDIQIQVGSLRLLVETEFQRFGGMLKSILQSITSPTNERDEIKQSLEDLKAEITELKQVISPVPPNKINLLLASQSEISNALVEAGVRDKYVGAALNAIECWKAPDRELSWTNLKKSTAGKSGFKVKDFGDTTLKKLKEIAEIK